MANLKSSKKDIRRIEKRTERNRSAKSALKTYVKKVRKAVEAGDSDSAQAAMVTAAKFLDKAAAKGIIHKNKPPAASRALRPKWRT